jgi:hypothetical protein
MLLFLAGLDLLSSGRCQVEQQYQPLRQILRKQIVLPTPPHQRLNSSSVDFFCNGSESFTMLFHFLTPSRTILFFNRDTHTAGSAGHHTHSRIDVCCIQIRHFQFSNFANLFFGHLPNFISVWFTGTLFQLRRFHQ